FVYIFFFQAEDGIRAFHVTGVQTCALPISRFVDPTGRGPTQASTSLVSPLRNRCARTPPVARPLAGYWDSGVTFTVSPVAVTTIGSPCSASSVRTAPKNTTSESLGRLIPATPPPRSP